MNDDNKVLEFCSIYRISFLVNDKRQRKISRIIVCPNNLKNSDVENLVYEKFARVSSVVQVYKIGDGIKFHNLNFKQEFCENGEKIRIETFWDDAEVLGMEYLNYDDQIKEHKLFVVIVSEKEKKELSIRIKQQFKEVKSVYRFTDSLEALSLK